MTEMRWMEIEEEEGRWGSDEVKEEDEDGGREGLRCSRRRRCGGDKKGQEGEGG